MLPDRFADHGSGARPHPDGARRKGHEGAGPRRRGEPVELAPPEERAVLVGAGPLPAGETGTRHMLEELERLARTAGARVVGQLYQVRSKPDAASYLGSGKLEELRILCRETSPTLVVADDDLTPAQVRNIEKVIDLRVIDRSELILDIFATHAGSRQARLQVELAQLRYMAPRLKRMWTHLSRITGAGGIGSRGPGEKQIEVDRRIIQRRIRDLQRQLREIEARREREVKARASAFKAALVGYTNAGKSTLMRALTGADVLVADQLFATLDTRTRRWRLPSGSEVLLSDTVGFIDKLPHHLMASFHATLEEVREADLLLHVADASDPEVERRVAVVRSVLERIHAGDVPEVLVLNKADLVPDRVELTLKEGRLECALTTSATTGRGLEDLASEVEHRSRLALREVELSIPASDGETLALVARRGQVLDQRYEGETCHLRAALPPALINRLDARLPSGGVHRAR